MFALKLHTKVVYRLALYQVLSALALSVMSLIKFTYSITAHNVYGPDCVAIGWFNFYTRWVKLLFTMWVAFHLFSFSVFHKNLKKFEVLYVVTSLLVPAVIACIPLTTNTYSSSRWCFLKHNTTDVIERVVLWDVTAVVILLIASAAMVTVAIKLAHRVRWREIVYKRITEGDQYWKALKQLLPLIAFPILYLVYMIFQLIFDIYPFSAPSNSTQVVVITPLWSMSSGVVLLIHIFVVKCSSRKGKDVASDILLENTLEPETSPIHHPGRPSRNSVTHYTLPPASV